MSDATILSYNETVNAGIRILRSGKNAIAAGRQGVRAFFVLGPPGTGKTAMRDAIAQGLGLRHQFILTMSHFEVPDIAGVPVPMMDTRRTHFFASADMLPPEGLKGGLLVTLDEVGDYNIAQQNLTCQFIFTNRTHNYEFPPDTCYFLTSNRVSDRSGANRILTKLGNRGAMVTVNPQPDELFDYGAKHGWNPTVLAFIKMHGGEQINPSDKRGVNSPTYFNSFDPADQAQMAMPQFSSSRSLDFVSSYFNDLEVNEPGLGDGHVIGDVAAMIGTPVASKLVAFRKIAMTMPDPDAILKGQKVPYPTKQEVLWALTLTLASKCKKADVKYLHAFLDKGPDEYLALAARLLFDTKVSELSGDEFHKLLQNPKLKQMF